MQVNFTQERNACTMKLKITNRPKSLEIVIQPEKFYYQFLTRIERSCRL